MGQAHVGLVPARAAAATTVMVDGLLLHMPTDPAGMPAKTATGIVDDHLARCVNLDTSRRKGR
ncbi:TetR family transcriptional regulator C-terminal domain-containing protein [Actinopolymorpha sp. NPDC004070]|uniref:TetR family transcriptional regulator C-terminal domain-containing protein n=1 Tax=Actinopolymorpha sp. NPDC004070 TaxID=3154548 RepID=UPI0033AB100A